MQDSVSGSAEQ